jgi:DNA-directed RNA polymerase subunit RPC12/RpoP
MEEKDEIIVFKRFENAIDANLAKTKLDAYGVPCFLTDEHLTNLYPLQNLILFGVRLHIFKQDQGMAEQVLSDVYHNQDEVIVCPRCRSKKVEMEYTQKFSSRILRVIIGFFLFILPFPKVYRCQDCEHEF